MKKLLTATNLNVDILSTVRAYDLFNPARTTLSRAPSVRIMDSESYPPAVKRMGKGGGYS